MSKGTRLAEDWKLPEEWAEDAEKIGLNSAQIYGESDRFRDYWIAKTGQSATKLDWRATWRNWCRKVVDYSPKTERAPAQEVKDVTTPYRSQNYHEIAKENLTAMRRRVR